ncbi:hypothetical protein CAPTEDRAFT_207644 [Capitella teleta]|uniref:Uncharacterized protein n=1 Tax=Capitella teleta TaxID=283909 RepID=R7TLE6_CAPTE|nr:hypothetical protein CAPTEDRAFT_207644 [Capitella teleta]|eukprot:ELT94499.1 hypothetical protein CAPTEDRAFT_207644 [Capitella teleta]
MVPVRFREVWSTFLAEKIDYQVFLETPPEQLEELVPAYRDRLALSNKARRMADSSCNSRETASTGMLARLKRKNAEHPSTSKKSLNMKGNRIAVKKDLRFELGLMKYTGNPSNPFKQVRSSQGGGPRHLTADRNTKIGEIHEIAQNLLFPEGYFRQGYLKNFSTTMRDVNGIEIPCSSSIHEQYHERKVKMLRMYLFIKTNAVPNEVPEAQQSDERTEGLSNLEPTLPDFPVHENNGLDDEKEKSVSVDGYVNFEQFDNGGLEGRPSMYDYPLSLDDNQSTLAEQPFPFDDDPPTLADQPIPLDDHSLIGGAQPSEEQSLKIKLHRGHVFEELNEAFQNNPAMKWLFGSSCWGSLESCYNVTYACCGLVSIKPPTCIDVEN